MGYCSQDWQMTRRSTTSAACLLACSLAASATISARSGFALSPTTAQGTKKAEGSTKKAEGGTKKAEGANKEDARAAQIARARVWTPTDIPKIDFRKGPGSPGAFAQGATVNCEYQDTKLAGRSPKFACRIAPNDDVKVKYGGSNAEVYGEVAATRLLWALGFGADQMYSVKVVCRGCPVMPGGIMRSNDEQVLDPAVIERKMPGKELYDDKGWAWTELDGVDEKVGGASRAERDALQLLAVFLQHSDNKPVQQRLLCLDEPAPEKAPECKAPLMMIGDLGLTFGRASLFNSNAKSGVNFVEWSRTPVWKDAESGAASCIGNLPKSATGTLENPAISEDGRQFLAKLLLRLSDQQIRDLFEVARFHLRVRDPGDPRSGFPTTDEWVDAFKQKRDQIVNRRCSEAPRQSG